MKPETMKGWVSILNPCCEMVAGLESMRNKEAADNEMRKEDSKNRVAHDKNDRENI